MAAPDPVVLERLEHVVPGGVRSRALDRLAMAHDASHYLLVPGAVVAPGDVEQLSCLLASSAAGGLPLTFRSGGTSLSGQAVTDGVLVDTRRHFRGIDVLDDGHRVRVQPGATVRQVNARLAPHSRRLGPDPASEAACTVGGVVANNSSGMACGTEFNTYRTLESMVLVLPSGTIIDSGAPDADDRLRALEPDLHHGLGQLRDRVRGNAGSVHTIQRQFALKNTMGYGINAFLDHTRPVDLLTRLVIGSEGTLAFVAEATYRTIPVATNGATGLLVFDGLRQANDALPELVAAGAVVIELLDATSLRVAQADPHADPVLRGLAVNRHAALLVEFQETSAVRLRARVADAAAALDRLPLSQPHMFTVDGAARAGLWHIRKGLYAAVAGAKPAGTTALLEDIAVPVPVLGEACEKLGELFRRHDYQDSVIFGHAKDGNVHFLLKERFEAKLPPRRYLAFTEDMVELVLGHGGTLKAEHGTGRIMAPFVRRQYGDELYDVMRSIKQLCDPRNVLNPGVLINDDPLVHVQHLKVTPEVEAEVDRCVECGYCEPVCPSKDLTLTPRQRIVLRREMADARTRGDTALLEELEHDYAYEGLQTCAADGMCQTACPVLIDTGQLVKRLRREQTGRTSRTVWRHAAGHWSAVSATAAKALDIAGALPPGIAVRGPQVARRMLGPDSIPSWTPDLPRGGSRRRPRSSDAPTAVYLPSCTGSMFGPAGDGAGVRSALLQLCERVGLELRIPDGVDGLCCGTPWRSKGYDDGYAVMQQRVQSALVEATEGGALRVVCDAASCSEGLHELLSSGTARVRSLQVVDAVAFVAEQVLPQLTVASTTALLALHPTCSSTRLGLNAALHEVAAALADNVFVPDSWTCCAFAGDRGLLHPELTASATSDQAAAVREVQATAHASVNRTCEIGMTRATGREYRHLLELLEAATRPAAEAGDS